MKITVLAGGLSPERNVSLSSARLIANALIRRGHRVLLLDVYEGVQDLPADLDTLFLSVEGTPRRISEVEPDLEALRRPGDASLIGPHVTELCRASDLVFIALHGSMGENGQLQATLDNFGIRYTGSGFIGCLLAMDKDLSKKLLLQSGIRTPRWICGRPCELSPERVLREIGLPCVVKPCSCGSSVGISMVEDEAGLVRALSDAARWEDRLIVEEKIVGRELTVGILGGKALPAIEIVPKEGFYDYKNKYQSGLTEEICPAPIPDEAAAELARITEQAFSALRLTSYARFDYMMDREGRFFCLEANALPGMTPTSLLPQAAAAVGISYDDLCEEIVRLA